MADHPFKHEKRHNISAQTFARVFARCGGRCQGQCNRKLGPGDRYDLDHIIALELGGTDDEDNLQLLCDGCHALKTKGDHSTAGHVRRSYTHHVAPREYRRSRSWGRR